MARVTIANGESNYVFDESDVTRLDFAGWRAKALIFIAILSGVELVLLFTLDFLLLGGGVAAIVIYYALHRPIEGKFADRRRSNPGFKPILRAKIPYSQITSAKMNAYRVNVVSGAMRFKIEIPEGSEADMLSLLREKLPPGALQVASQV